jgi:hypothetical protein
MVSYPQAALELLAATPEAGFALQDATPVILTWTAPNDGNLHRVTVFGLIHVASTETGGLVSLTYTGPFAGAALHTSTLWAAALASDTAGQATASPASLIVGPGTTVAIVQGTALTGGAATVYAEIWGS